MNGRIRFYEKIAPRVKLRTPRCYYSAINVKARKYVLLLEDMAPVQSGDLVVGSSLEQAELAIREIAGFHATWWESPELEEMTWMPRFGRVQISQLSDMYQLAWDPFCERMGHRLPEQMLEQAQKACEFSVPRYIAAVLDLNAGELLPK